MLIFHTSISLALGKQTAICYDPPDAWFLHIRKRYDWGATLYVAYLPAKKRWKILSNTLDGRGANEIP